MQLIRSLKLDAFIKGEKKYATEALSLLETYMTKNPRIHDIRMLLSDDQACEKYRKWSLVKKNYKEMMGGSGSEKKSGFLSKDSFKRVGSKGSLFSGGHSEEETNLGTLNMKTKISR